MVPAIMNTFNIVPIPGCCFKGNQRIRTLKLTMKVEKPIVQFVEYEIPCANTVQGLTPAPLPMIIASPRPNRNNPKTR